MGRRLRIRGALRRPHKNAPTESPKKFFTRAIFLIGLRSMIYSWGGHNYSDIASQKGMMPSRILAQHCKRIIPWLAAPAALLLSQGQAKAVLTYNIFESGGNVVVQTSGSLNLTGSQDAGSNYCAVNGAILSRIAIICTGTDPGTPINARRVSGPINFNGSVSRFGATSVSGMFTMLKGLIGQLALDPAYVSNDPIVSSATFNGTTLAGLGFTTTGLIGTWSLIGTSETIKVFIGNSASAAVPGPLPLLGAGAAFGWSRRLRKRIAAPLITPPQA